MKTTKLAKTAEWSLEDIKKFDEQIAKIAANFGLDTYPNQIEVITSEQMLDSIASVGMPVNYSHWSFGKKYLQLEKKYLRGYMGLAYEIVINSNPCIAYLLEENTLPMQAIVLAHACYGHNSFFKGNYLFKIWTNPDAIIDYLMFAKKYISDCEETYGFTAVEEILDACHALMNYGVDRYRHPAKLSLKKESERQKIREEYSQSQINILWSTIPKSTKTAQMQEDRFPLEPQENILYFIEKNAPLLEQWQREIIRIVRKIAQYFYPQRQTQVMNEGWATFWHYTILNKMFDEKLVSNQFMLEFIQSHTNVIFQPPFDSPQYTGINPYALGYNIYKEIRRICEEPTDEDKIWFPQLIGKSWFEAIDFAMRNFKDESFIAQYLTPNLIRQMKLFAVLDDDKNPDLRISAIHDESGYHLVRQALSEQYNIGNLEPNIQVYNVDRRGDRSLTLRHLMHKGRPLGKDTEAILLYLHKLWAFPVRIESVNDAGLVLNTYHYPT